MGQGVSLSQLVNTSSVSLCMETSIARKVDSLLKSPKLRRGDLWRYASVALTLLQIAMLKLLFKGFLLSTARCC